MCSYLEINFYSIWLVSADTVTYIIEKFRAVEHTRKLSSLAMTFLDLLFPFIDFITYIYNQNIYVSNDNTSILHS